MLPAPISPPVYYLLTALAIGASVWDSPIILAEDRELYPQVQVLFRQKCLPCHGTLKQEAGLRLDHGSYLLAGGQSGPPVDLADRMNSPILLRVESKDPDERMPPIGEPLTAEQTNLVRRWLEQPSLVPLDEPKPVDWRSHWSFQPLANESLFQGNHSIDSWIVRGLKEKKLEMSPAADLETRLRRASLILLGLPPTADDITSLVGDTDPLAFERRIDGMLASPRFGERWAQHWLDIIRYADTHGYEVNTPRPNAWPYRDYVIQAFNRDLPYDEFVREQLSGDALNADAATGFLVAAPVLLPGQIGADDASKRLARQDALAEIITGTSAAILGMSFGCARCHDHKFDPFTQEDYYSFQAYFAGVEYDERPIADPTAELREQQARSLSQSADELRSRLDAAEPLAMVESPSTASSQAPDAEELRSGDPASAVPRTPDGLRAPNGLRAPVQSRVNVDRFAPVLAKYIRFTIESTVDDNLHEPCLDELEIFSVGSNENLGLASRGAIATSSGNYSDQGIHQLPHIHDGKYGNSFSWISDTHGAGWIQIELPKPAWIERIVWGRDREEKFRDRLATRYRIELAETPNQWKRVASSVDRLAYGSHFDPVELLAKTHPEHSAELRAAFEELQRLERQINLLRQPRMLFAGRFREPDPTFVLARGDAEQPQKAVEPRLPTWLVSHSLEAHEALGSTTSITDSRNPPQPEQLRRLQLASQLNPSRNPLIARVIVNRIWQHYFGTALVDTPNDFGLNGSQPTHPELLDWLASELIRANGSLKHIHRLILLSDTFQQSSRMNSDNLAIDADSKYLWRFPSRRMEAEALRDRILMVAGQLHLEMGGPGFDFFKSKGGLDGFPPIIDFQADGFRRMIYAHKIRMEPVPVFGAFDCPDAGQPIGRRTLSTTALQALNLFNGPFIIGISETTADRIASKDPLDLHSQVHDSFRRVLGRSPSPSEIRASIALVQQYDLALLIRVLINSNEFLFIP